MRSTIQPFIWLREKKESWAARQTHSQDFMKIVLKISIFEWKLENCGCNFENGPRYVVPSKVDITNDYLYILHNFLLWNFWPVLNFVYKNKNLRRRGLNNLPFWYFFRFGPFKEIIAIAALATKLIFYQELQLERIAEKCHYQVFDLRYTKNLVASTLLLD